MAYLGGQNVSVIDNGETIKIEQAQHITENYKSLENKNLDNGSHGVPTPFANKKRRGGDSNPRSGFTPLDGLANRYLQPLGHLSKLIIYNDL
jgi:hypothetical protein